MEKNLHDIFCPTTTGISYFAISHGGRQRHGWWTAKVFVVRRGRQKWTATYGTTKSYIAIRFGRLTAKGPLPSAADGKEY